MIEATQSSDVLLGTIDPLRVSCQRDYWRVTLCMEGNAVQWKL